MLTGGVCNVFFAGKQGLLAIGGSHTAPVALLSPCAHPKSAYQTSTAVGIGGYRPKKAMSGPPPIAVNWGFV